MSTPRDVVERQIAASTRRDIDGFVACYAADAQILRPDDSALATGREQIRAQYRELFERSPQLHAEIRGRIEVGSFVIDEEFVTGFVLPDMPSEVHAVAAYRVADDLIQRTHLFFD